jgi:hypothetical protein
MGGRHTGWADAGGGESRAAAPRGYGVGGRNSGGLRLDDGGDRDRDLGGRSTSDNLGGEGGVREEKHTKSGEEEE